MSLTKQVKINLLYTMMEIRRFEEKVQELFLNNKIPGFSHVSIGQEAVAAGVCLALDEGDYITSTHRGHGHCIAKGMDFPRMFAELMGRETGFCRGKGGSMHIAEYAKGVIGANGIVGGGIPIATGAALSAQIQNNGQVAACFFGDGAMAEGAFHESLNIAALWKLPILYVCENNQYGEWTHYTDQHPVEDLSLRASAYGIPGHRVDGMNAIEVYEFAREAVERARQGKGASLLACDTYRYQGHSIGGPPISRPQDEIEEWKRRDPINSLDKDLTEAGALTEAEIASKNGEIEARIEEAVAFAENSSFPSPASALEDVLV